MEDALLPWWSPATDRKELLLEIVEFAFCWEAVLMEAWTDAAGYRDRSCCCFAVRGDERHYHGDRMEMQMLPEVRS
ncbi:hypothetical protein ACLOJK_037391 [Asimina triloba]